MIYGYYCGVLCCGKCGDKFTTHNILNELVNGEEKQNILYRCNQKSLFRDEVCNSPDITHSIVERAFCEYIQSISINTDDIIQAEQELSNIIIDGEKNLTILQNRKKQIMEQYMQGNIEFDEYKYMLKMFTANYEVLENELKLQKERQAHGNIITNLKKNWGHLDDTEKTIFIQRFIRKIVIVINSSIVKIDSVEFNTGERQTNELQKSEPSRRESVRKKLRQDL